MRLAITWEGNVTGERAFRVISGPAPVYLVLVAEDDGEERPPSPSITVKTGPVAKPKREGGRLVARLPAAGWRPYDVTFQAEWEGMETAPLTASLRLVSERSRRVAAGLLVLCLLLALYAGAISIDLVTSRWSKALAAVSGTTLVAVVTAAVSAFRRPNALPSGGLIHDWRQAGALAAALLAGVLAVPFLFLTRVANDTEGNVSLERGGNEAPVPLEARESVMWTSRLEDAELLELLGDAEGERFCLSDLRRGAGGAAPGCLLENGGEEHLISTARERHIGCRLHAWPGWEALRADDGQPLLRFDNDPACQPRKDQPRVVEMARLLGSRPALDRAPRSLEPPRIAGAAAEPGKAEVELRYRKDVPPERLDQHLLLEVRTTTTLDVRMVDPEGLVTRVELRAESPGAGPSLTPARRGSRLRMALAAIEPLGTLSCSAPQDVDRVVAWLLPARGRVASLLVVDGGARSSWSPESPDHQVPAAMCLAIGAPAGAPADGVPDAAELHLRPSFYPDAAWRIAFPDRAPAATEIYIDERDKIGTVTCSVESEPRPAPYGAAGSAIPFEIVPVEVLGRRGATFTLAAIEGSHGGRRWTSAFKRAPSPAPMFPEWVWLCRPSGLAAGALEMSVEARSGRGEASRVEARYHAAAAGADGERGAGERIKVALARPLRQCDVLRNLPVRIAPRTARCEGGFDANWGRDNERDLLSLGCDPGKVRKCDP